MAVHWGVDSWNKATAKPPGRKENFWDWVCKTYNRSPEFWGRYILGTGGPPLDSTGKPKQSGQDLDDSEAQFLLSKDCRILPIVTVDHQRMTIGGKQGEANGKSTANRTLKVIEDLHLPAGVFVYLDIEPEDKPSVEWIVSLWDTMVDAKRGIPGFYCSPLNWNFHVPYCKALEQRPQFKGDGVAKRLWSITPYRGCQADPSVFSADSPKCAPGVSAVVQYATKCHGGLIDLDLANDDGFNGMWKR